MQALKTVKLRWQDEKCNRLTLCHLEKPLMPKSLVKQLIQLFFLLAGIVTGLIYLFQFAR